MLNITINIEIIEGCKQKQPKAQEYLYKTCYPVFMKICLRYADYDNAANILQDSFIKIFTKIDSYSGSGDMVGWMRKIVVNTCLDFVRSNKKTNNTAIENIPDVAEEEQENKYVVDEKHLLQMIRQLPEKHALVFNLYVMEEYSHQEIADSLNITVASSKWYLHEARKILQAKIAQLKDE